MYRLRLHQKTDDFFPGISVTYDTGNGQCSEVAENTSSVDAHVPTAPSLVLGVDELYAAACCGSIHDIIDIDHLLIFTDAHAPYIRHYIDDLEENELERVRQDNKFYATTQPITA